MTKLHPSITHISSDKSLSEESIASINKIANLVYKLTDAEIKEMNRLVQIKLKQKDCKHQWTYWCGTPQNETHRCTKCGAVG